MVNLDWWVDAHADVSLVELVVENPTGTARRVRIANRLDGAVWPPRREGVPEAGWDDGGFEGVVPSGGRRALGYASPAPSAEPPVELVWTERAGESEYAGAFERARRPERDESFGVQATPEGVVRALGDARPPADAVPTPSRNPRGSRKSPEFRKSPDPRRSPDSRRSSDSRRSLDSRRSP